MFRQSLGPICPKAQTSGSGIKISQHFNEKTFVNLLTDLPNILQSAISWKILIKLVELTEDSVHILSEIFGKYCLVSVSMFNITKIYNILMGKNELRVSFQNDYFVDNITDINRE